MREIAIKKKPVFVQANSNSGQGHVLHYITSFCVVFGLSTLYFRLTGKTETKQVVNRISKWVEGDGSWKCHESGQAVFLFLAASPLARPGSLFPIDWENWNQTSRQQDVKMSWRGWQLKMPRIRAGGFSFSRGFAARAPGSTKPPCYAG